jgi:dihydroorotase
MAHEAVVRAKILQQGEVKQVSIGIDKGRIMAMGQHLQGTKVYDYTNCIALPGGVDTHTHMREPGCEHKEDFSTGTLSAAFGGTTTVLDMPNTQPEVVNIEAYEEKSGAVEGKANVDYGLFGELISPHSVIPLAEKAIGFKLFMSETTGTEGIFEKAEELLAHHALAGKVITVHAEDSSLFGPVTSVSLKAHNVKRNMDAEVGAVEKIINTGTQGIINLAHLTTGKSVELAKEKKVRYEVTPHHLLLNDEADLGALGKVNPPLRHKDTVAALFEDVKQGCVDIIASDHAPHALNEKEGEFEYAPSGVPGVETRIPLFMALAKKDLVSLETVQMACCENPANLFNLPKGHIAEGYDADLALYDMNEVTKILGKDLHSKCGWTPFEGFDAIFPVTVFLRGEAIIQDGELLGEKRGRPL